MPSEIDIAMEKAMMRQRLRGELSELAKPELLARSAAACERLCALEEFDRAQVVMMFLSLPYEVETTSAVSQALASGKTVAVPKVNWNDHVMGAVELKTLDCEMTQDRYELRYPVQAQPVAPARIDLVVVPGLAFDDKGNRLGRGGGFYDRFLGGDMGAATTCGLALQGQLIEQIPIDVQDIPLNMLVTDSRVWRFNHQP